MKRSDYTNYDQLPLFLNAEMAAVGCFSADFTAAGVIVAGEEYPLGYFAAEALEVSGQLTLDIGAAAKEFAAEAQMFFAARDPSSAGIANEAFRRLWHGCCAGSRSGPGRSG